MSDLDPLWGHTPAHGTAAVAFADPTPVGGIPIARQRNWPRRLLVGGIAFVLLSISYYTVTLYQVHSVGRSDQARPVDAIVVMGAAQYDGRPSPQLAARLDHAADLWSAGVAKVMVVTGGNQPGDRFTEAEASADYLIERGVPAEAILQESRGHSSYASLDGVATMLHQRGLFRVLLVSDPFHSLRSRLIAQELGLVAYVSPTRTSPVRGKEATAKEMQEAAGIALGRIISFKRLLSITG
ncbi:MAG: YdcF family protein [Ilumatobacteraceae bacterium]|nr:YdcF family protein [Ilumatobacteraceae bacterium]